MDGYLQCIKVNVSIRKSIHLINKLFAFSSRFLRSIRRGREVSRPSKKENGRHLTANIVLTLVSNRKGDYDAKESMGIDVIMAIKSV